MNKYYLLVVLLLVSLTLVGVASNYPTGAWIGYNADTGKFIPVAVDASGTVLVEGIGGASESAIKAQVDTINEESGGSTLTDSLDLVDSNYTNIKAALASTGVDMTGVKPSGYAGKVAATSDNYRRPSFWPELPAIAVDGDRQPTEQVIHMLVAVFPGKQTFKWYRVWGACTINWGDGNTVNYAAADQVINHDFIYDNIAAPINERGYKCVVVTVRPQAGQTFTYLYGASLGLSNNILDFKAAFSGAGTIVLREERMLESVEFVGNVVAQCYIADGTGVGALCPRLQRCILSTPTNTNCGSVFGGVAKVPELVDISAATYARYLLYLNGANNDKGVRVTMPKVPCDAAFFAYASSLKEIICDDCSNIIGFSNAFTGCSNLQVLRVPNIKVSFPATGTMLDYDALKTIIEQDLFPGVTGQTFTITDSYGATEVMAAISAGTIVVPAGWTVAI